MYENYPTHIKAQKSVKNESAQANLATLHLLKGSQDFK